jgi:hypothetical protein
MIKSQNELNTCNDGKRSSDVLLQTIEKCERLEQQCRTWKDIAIGVILGNLCYLAVRLFY